MEDFVFSAHAEVVPTPMLTSKKLTRILRARGGSSTPEGLVMRFQLYSPRTRR